MKVEVIGETQVKVLLDPREHVKVYNMAFGRLATRARGVARRTMSKTYGVKLSATKGIAIKKKRGSNGINDITLWGGAWHLNLIKDLKARDTKKRGVVFSLAGRQQLSNSFIANSTAGTEQVFTRKGPARLPIHREDVGQYAKDNQIPRIDEMLTDERTITAIETMMNSEAEKETQRAMTAFVSRKVNKMVK